MYIYIYKYIYIHVIMIHVYIYIIAETLRKDSEEKLQIQGESLRIEGENMLGQIRAELNGEYI
jgi:hypothetical protein